MEIKEEEVKIDIGTLLQYNEKSEANAIIDYNDLLNAVKKSDLTKNKKDIIESVVYEIIGDELNHQDRLKMLYSLVTGIKENKD